MTEETKAPPSGLSPEIVAQMLAKNPALAAEILGNLDAGTLRGVSKTLRKVKKEREGELQQGSAGSILRLQKCEILLPGGNRATSQIVAVQNARLDGPMAGESETVKISLEVSTRDLQDYRGEVLSGRVILGDEIGKRPRSGKGGDEEMVN